MKGWRFYILRWGTRKSPDIVEAGPPRSGPAGISDSSERYLAFPAPTASSASFGCGGMRIE